MAGSLGFFGLLRLNWTEAHLVLPLTRIQARLALGLFGTPGSPVEATLACSGTDALALCLGAIVAYPVKWRSRLAGCCGGAALILGLNTLRIGLSDGWPSRRRVQHPSRVCLARVLTLAIAGYVFAWMRLADSGARRLKKRSAPLPPSPLLRCDWLHNLATVRRAHVCISAPVLSAPPRSMPRAPRPRVGRLYCPCGRGVLGVAGISAHAAANVLWTPRGGFLVTEECIFTPLIPIYVAAICAYSATWRRLVVGVLATLPLFLGLGIVRLWSSRCCVVCLADFLRSRLLSTARRRRSSLPRRNVAAWRQSGVWPRAGRRHRGSFCSSACSVRLTPAWSHLRRAPLLTIRRERIALLPTFQVGLYLALCVAAFAAVGWQRFIAGLAVLGLTRRQVCSPCTPSPATPGLTAHVRDVRGWAIAGPVLIFTAMVNIAPPRR